jgi:amino acid permease
MDFCSSTYKIIIIIIIIIIDVVTQQAEGPLQKKHKHILEEKSQLHKIHIGKN